MGTPETGEITQLLQRWREGSHDAENELFTLVLPNLRRLAQYMMKRERRGHSMQATELVDQIYIRLVKAKDRDWQNRQHFYAIAARVMRRYLIDHARGRPNAHFLSFDGLQRLMPTDGAKLDLALTIDQLLEQLGKEHPEWCTVVEMKYFLGLTDEETANALGLKLRTMQRMWVDARQWLFDQLGSAHAQ
ncbi:MAG TPA: ECF-type sigma factor [Bryobacteraceae bacterium]|nr:ECF-type sigma factor [Bryobacteraceae bacterium]